MAGYQLDLSRKKIARSIDASGVFPVETAENFIPLIRWPLLHAQSWLDHGFSTRIGGVSCQTLSSLNFGYGAEADPEKVRENFRRLAGAGGFDPENIVLSAQTHSTNIRIVTEEDRGKGYSRERDYSAVDGLVTNVRDLALVIYFSDCVPLLVADPVHRAVGCAHSGWRGTVGNIAGELVKTMSGAYGTKPEDLVAVIGPSICRECFEVGEEVAEQFIRYAAAMGFSREQTDRICMASLDEEKRARGKFHVDLQEVCRLSFYSAGLKEEHVSVPDLCTRCNHHLLFSRRGAGQNGPYGQNASYLRIL